MFSGILLFNTSYWDYTGSKAIFFNWRVRILRLNVKCFWMRTWKILCWICFNARIQIRFKAIIYDIIVHKQGEFWTKIPVTEMLPTLQKLRQWWGNLFFSDSSPSTDARFCINIFEFTLEIPSRTIRQRERYIIRQDSTVTHFYIAQCHPDAKSSRGC